MNNFIKIKVITSNPNRVIKIIKSFNINIYQTIYDSKYVILKINEKDYKKINKLYQIEILDEYGIKSFIKKIKNNILKLILIVFPIILIIVYSSIIIDIKIITQNSDLRSLISNELDRNNLKKFSFYLNENKLNDIKKIILERNKDKIEWLNIEKKGMNYIINVEPKVKADTEKQPTYCHIIANKEGTISKIISKKGQELKEINENVKKDDIIISGSIENNGTEVSKVCAEGQVFAYTWYTIDITTSNIYTETIKKDNFRYNILVKFNNKSRKIFKSRLSEFKDENTKILDIFGFELYLQKEIEVEEKTQKYTDEILEEKINKLVTEKMNSIIKKENSIISRKVLKKEQKDSKIYIEMFIVAEEEIGKTIYPPDEEVKYE